LGDVIWGLYHIGKEKGEDNSIKYVRIVDDRRNIVYDDINKSIFNGGNYNEEMECSRNRRA